MEIDRRTIEIETFNTPKVLSDVTHLAHFGNNVDMFYDLVPYSTSSNILTMPTDEEGGRWDDSPEDDLRTIRCHIEARIEGAMGIIKASNTLRLMILHEAHGIILVVEPIVSSGARRMNRDPDTYRVIGAEEAVDALGTKVDALE